MYIVVKVHNVDLILSETMIRLNRRRLTSLATQTAFLTLPLPSIPPPTSEIGKKRGKVQVHWLISRWGHGLRRQFISWQHCTTINHKGNVNTHTLASQTSKAWFPSPAVPLMAFSMHSSQRFFSFELSAVNSYIWAKRINWLLFTTKNERPPSCTCKRTWMQAKKTSAGNKCEGTQWTHTRTSVSGKVSKKHFF